MATKYTKEWTEFFTGSGIPAEAASTYALIFYENRIQKNMLLDLNKEYLRDMGITVMGDIIAILRYAKIAYKKYISEQIIVEKSELPLESKDKSMFSNKNTPITNAKTKIQWNDLELMDKKKEIQTPKIKRVLQEDKLGYKIKMPTEVAERSVMSEQNDKKEMKTVFDRLGESSVSSTTSEIIPVNSIFNGSGSTGTSVNKTKALSVFSRLGEKTMSVVSSTSPFDPGDHLPAENVSNSVTSKSVFSSKKNFTVATMRADNEQQKILKNNSDGVKEISIKKRLGVTKMTPYHENDGKLNSLPRKNFLDKMETPKLITDQRKDTISHKNVENRTNIKQVAITTAKKPQLLNGMDRIKRKLGSDSMKDITFSKKVRFGETTLRLIPSTSPNTAKKTDHLMTRDLNTKQMLIKSRSSPLGFRPINKPLQGRLFKRTGGIISDSTKPKKKCSISDRLG